MKITRFAPYLFVFLWSTGFVGAKYGLPFADPFIFLALRVFVAAIILFLVALFLKNPVTIARRDIGKSALIGFFLHACYLGGVFFSIASGLSAGVAAVVTSIQPVLVSVLAVKVLGEKLKGLQIVGLFIGLTGVLLVLMPSFTREIPFIGFLAITVALIGSTTATLLQKKIGSGIPLVVGTAYQYLSAGLVLVAIAIATDETSIQWSASFTLSFIWLVGALSVGAVLLLLWLLNTGSAASVSSLFYLVPPATAIEAYFLFGESVNAQGAMGIAITALGVWMVIKAKS